MDLNPRVSCVLVNWNGWKDTVACLDALKKSTYTNLDVIVVDNGSTNDSVERIKAAHPDVFVLEAGKNLGLPSGNNVGLRYSLAHGADYVWTLNNDTEPHPDALSALVRKIQTDKRIGSVGSVCYYADSPSTVQVWGGARVNLWTAYTRNTNEPRDDSWFDALYGASMLSSRAALEDVGLMDGGFFHYWEETEFCVRLHKKGWRIAVAPNSRVLHKVHASTGGKVPVLDRYFTASGLRFIRLHSPIPLLTMFLFLSARLLRRLWSFRFSQCRAIWAGVLDYRRNLPVIPQIH